MGESKIEDFSELVTPVKGDKAAVFWNVEDYPFPDSSNPDPDMIYHKIESDLSERGVSGYISIWAYVDEENTSWVGEFLRNKTKTWKSRIFFLPRGDKRYRIINDIILWVMDNPSDNPWDDLLPFSLIVVSDGFRYEEKFFNMLETISFEFYNVFLVSTTQHIRPESSDWPGLLLDEVYSFDSEREEKRHKKHKADGA